MNLEHMPSPVLPLLGLSDLPPSCVRSEATAHSLDCWALAIPSKTWTGLSSTLSAEYGVFLMQRPPAPLKWGSRTMCSHDLPVSGLPWDAPRSGLPRILWRDVAVFEHLMACEILALHLPQQFFRRLLLAKPRVHHACLVEIGYTLILSRSPRNFRSYFSPPSQEPSEILPTG
ncbi:hypothetical protein BD779DRAFT_1566728, partial [Infundibulicybe gibba]